MSPKTSACEQTLQRMDACVTAATLAGAPPDVVQHLNICSTCANELNARKKMRDRLKGAVQAIPVPLYLESRIRRNMRSRESAAKHWLPRLLPVAAALVICIAGTIAYQLGHLRWTGNSQNAYIARISNSVATLMRAGLGDHVHCAVFRKYPKNPPKLEELAKDMAPEYRGLIPVVTEHVPGDYRLMMAHQCRYQGRRFVHLTVLNDRNLLSLVITKKADSESFQTGNMIPALMQSGIPFYEGNVQRFSIAAFESKDHLVYVVSDLPTEQNIQILTAVAPGIKQELSKAEL